MQWGWRPHGEVCSGGKVSYKVKEKRVIIMMDKILQLVVQTVDKSLIEELKFYILTA